MSAAFAIYSVMHPEISKKLPIADMALLWGTDGAAFNQTWMRRSEANGHVMVGNCRTWSNWDILPAFMRKDSLFDPSAADKRPVCPYHVTIPVRALKDYGEKNPFGPLDAHLKGATVFYGTALMGMHDVIESPVHGTIPGVHLHAMALDNLLTWGKQYLVAEEFEICHWTRATLMTIFCLLLIALADFALHWHKNHCHRDFSWFGLISRKKNLARYSGQRCVKALPHLRYLSIRVMIYLTLCASLYFAGRYLFHLGILSWIEYALLPLLMELLDKIDSVEVWIEDNFLNEEKQK
jgi:hypothetical protein